MMFPEVLRSVLLMILAMGTFNTASAQEKKFTLNLNPAFLQILRETGSLKSTQLNEAEMQFISHVQLQLVEAGNIPPIDRKIVVTRQGDDLIVPMDDSLIESLSLQPVRIEVADNLRGFKQVLLVYRPSGNEVGFDSVRQNGNLVDGAPFAVVRLSNGQSYEGTLASPLELELSTVWGKAKLPIDIVLAIHYDHAAEGNGTVILKNGDSLTGRLTLSEIKLDTSWGQAEIDAAWVESLVRDRQLRFRRDETMLGPRWVLTREMP